MSASGGRYSADRLPFGTDRITEEADNLETPHFAGTGKLRRGVVAPDWSRIVEGTRFAGDVAIQQLREGRALEPDPDPAADEPAEQRPMRWGVFLRWAAVIVIAAGATFLILQLVPNWRTSRDQASAGPTLQSASVGQGTGVKVAAVDPTKPPAAGIAKPAEPVAPRQPKATLRAAEEPNRTTVGEAVPLGMNVDGSTEGVLAIVTGLLPGSNLSVGTPVGATVWQLPARDLARVLVRPPAGFSGTMEIVVDLQVGGDEIVDRRWRRLEWTSRPVRAAAPAEAAAPPRPVVEPPAPRAAATETSAPRAPSESSPTRTLDPDEIAVLLRRGEQLIETGDLSSARLLLRRAAEARDGRAAFALAGTYDPLVLGKLGVYGFSPDVAAARYWYQKAAEFGSREASARLDSLASTGSR
jgi:hypothetical protein